MSYLERQNRKARRAKTPAELRRVLKDIYTGPDPDRDELRADSFVTLAWGPDGQVRVIREGTIEHD